MRVRCWWTRYGEAGRLPRDTNHGNLRVPSPVVPFRLGSAAFSGGSRPMHCVCYAFFRTPWHVVRADAVRPSHVRGFRPQREASAPCLIETTAPCQRNQRLCNVRPPAVPGCRRDSGRLRNRAPLQPAPDSRGPRAVPPSGDACTVSANLRDSTMREVKVQVTIGPASSAQNDAWPFPLPGERPCASQNGRSLASVEWSALVIGAADPVLGGQGSVRASHSHSETCDGRYTPSPRR